MRPVEEIYRLAKVAAKNGSRWVYINNYVTTGPVISRAEPDTFSIDLTKIDSHTYSAAAGVSLRQALSELRRAAAAELIAELPKGSGCVRFRLPADEARQIGVEIINDLSESGMKFDERLSEK